ncbi:hypothetical protein C1J03_13465 [Sulfitobacter sp. SK012]|nr:hypothetical protein C1J03_13465 [Sulfitobacter sp. SK012]
MLYAAMRPVSPKQPLNRVVRRQILTVSSLHGVGTVETRTDRLLARFHKMPSNGFMFISLASLVIFQNQLDARRSNPLNSGVFFAVNS